MGWGNRLPGEGSTTPPCSNSLVGAPGREASILAEQARADRDHAPRFLGSGNAGKARQRIQYPAPANARARVLGRSRTKCFQQPAKKQTGIRQESGRNQAGIDPVADGPAQRRPRRHRPGLCCRDRATPYRPPRGPSLRSRCHRRWPPRSGDSASAAAPRPGYPRWCAIRFTRPMTQLVHVHHAAIAAAVASVSHPAGSAVTLARQHGPVSAANAWPGPVPPPLPIPGGANCAFPTGPMHPRPDSPRVQQCTFPIGPMHPRPESAPGPKVFTPIRLKWTDFPHFGYESPAIRRCSPSPNSCTRP